MRPRTLHPNPSSGAPMQLPTLGFAPRLALFYAAAFAVMGTQTPFFPVWLDWRGLSAREIAVITSVPLVFRLAATPFITFVADRTGARRSVILTLAWCGLAIGLYVASARYFWPILIAQIIYTATWGSMMPLADAVAMAGVKATGESYGRMRLWGSVSFMAANLIGGWLVGGYGASAAMVLIVLCLAATAGAAHLLPVQRDTRHAASTPIAWPDVLALLRSKAMVLFLIAAGGVQAGHAVLYIFGTLHWRAQGFSALWCGLFWAIGIVAEIAVFALPSSLIQRVGALMLLRIGAVGAIVRWTIMGFDPPLALLIPLQALHGATFGASHLGAMHMLARIVPERQSGIGQALYGTLSGSLALAASMQIAGYVYANHGGRAYWAMAALGCISLAAVAALARSPTPVCRDT
jgi:MFS transporter, PPP family, 3-phenylpropionic acid transporter